MKPLNFFAKYPVSQNLLLISLAFFATFFMLILAMSNAVKAEAEVTKTCADGSVVPANFICATIQDPEVEIQDKPTTSPGPEQQNVSADPNNRNFRVLCTDWSGTPAWKPSSVCSVTNADVLSAAGGKQSWGVTAVDETQVGDGFVPRDVSLNPITYYDSDKSCAPNGDKSRYAQTWNLQVIQTYQRNWDWVLDTSTNEWNSTPSASVLSGEQVTYTKVGCVPPQNSIIQVRCSWNYGGNSSYSPDKNRPIAAWEDFGSRPTLSSDPSVPTGGNGQVAPTCDDVGNTNVVYAKPVDNLGYYKIYVDYNYRIYTNLKWVTSSGTVLYSQWSQGLELAGSSTTWWAYSCSADLTNAVEGAYYSQETLPNRDAFLNPANCSQATWECQLSSPQTVGLDLSKVAAGIINPTTPVTVMRNGEKISVTFSEVRIIDTTNGTNIDITNGGIGAGIKNITNIEYKTEVREGSTPFFGTDANDPKQYFKLFKSATSDSTDKWGKWYSDANTNLDKNLSFMWASDNGKPFIAERTYRVTGSFLVPQGGDVSTSTSAGTPQGSEWKVGTYDCLDYDYSSGARVSNGPLTAYTNDVNVVRSVSDAG
jgi:hypothetical protein